MSRKDRERELLTRLQQSQAPEVELVKEYLRLREGRNIDAMLSTGCDMKRGAACELREVLKQLDKGL